METYLHFPGCSRLYIEVSVSKYYDCYNVCYYAEHEIDGPYWKIHIVDPALLVPFSFEEHFGMLEPICQAYLLKVYV